MILLRLSTVHNVPPSNMARYLLVFNVPIQRFVVNENLGLGSQTENRNTTTSPSATT